MENCPYITRLDEEIMKEPSTYEKIHWFVFNALVKTFAYGLVFVSAIFILLIMATILGKPIGAEYPTWFLVVFVPLPVLDQIPPYPAL